jgi:hypothetical protein
MKKPSFDNSEFWRKQQVRNLKRIRRRNRVVKELNTNRRNYRQANAFGQRRDFRPFQGRKELEAPENFSFIDNTEEMVNFLNRMEKAFGKGFDVYVDFSKIKKLSPDSLAVLVSNMKDSKITRGLNCSGNEPEDEQIKKKFIESGFYEIVVPRDKKEQVVSGSFRKKSNKKVQPEMIDNLVSFATKTLFGKERKCGGVTNALLETMGNTRGHAAGDSVRHETWWAYVHCDMERKIATYCLVDNGVGIFQSRKVGRVRQVLNSIGFTSNIDILKKMLNRQIESSTGISYRGRGIPSIYKSLKRGDIRNLTFIANDVIAKVEKDEYHTLSRPFKGTFISWEYHGDTDGKVNAASA